MWHQPYGPMDHTSWWAPFQTILPLLLLVALVGVVVWLIVRTSRQPAAVTPGAAAAPRVDAALEQARLRYAQGAIDRDQYLRITQDLSGAEPGGPAAEPPPSLEP